MHAGDSDLFLRFAWDLGGDEAAGVVLCGLSVVFAAWSTQVYPGWYQAGTRLARGLLVTNELSTRLLFGMKVVEVVV